MIGVALQADLVGIYIFEEVALLVDLLVLLDGKILVLFCCDVPVTILM